MKEIILFTHGSLGESLDQTASKIIGEHEGVTCISNENLSPSEVFHEISQNISRINAKNNQIMIAVDLIGGNTWNIARKVSRERNHINIVSGLNLGMLLSFLTKREHYSIDELVDILVTDGSRHINKCCDN